MQRCARCLLPESYPGLSLDEDAICNHCHTYQPKQKYGGQAELLYLGHIFQGSNPGGYDCLVALSGGRDSSFAAWYAVKQMGLKALGYTFDNGFMPEETRRNVAKVTRVLGMDHVYFTPGDMRRSERPLLKAWMAGPSPATIALLCTGCQAGYKIGLRRVAREHQIRFVISGSGEPQTSFAERLLAHDPHVPQHAAEPPQSPARLRAGTAPQPALRSPAAVCERADAGIPLPLCAAQQATLPGGPALPLPGLE